MKQGFVKLVMPSEGKQSRRSLIQGGTVVADYVKDNQRVIVVERTAAKAAAPKAKKHVARAEVADASQS